MDIPSIIGMFIEWMTEHGQRKVTVGWHHLNSKAKALISKFLKWTTVMWLTIHGLTVAQMKMLNLFCMLIGLQIPTPFPTTWTVEQVRLQVKQRLMIQILLLQRPSRQVRALLLHTTLTAVRFHHQARQFRRYSRAGILRQTEEARHTTQV